MFKMKWSLFMEIKKNKMDLTQKVICNKKLKQLSNRKHFKCNQFKNIQDKT